MKTVVLMCTGCLQYVVFAALVSVVSRMRRCTIIARYDNINYCMRPSKIGRLEAVIQWSNLSLPQAIKRARGTETFGEGRSTLPYRSCFGTAPYIVANVNHNF